jgi:homoserine dehydrogenase
MNDPFRIGILGLGVVGSGTVQLLRQNAEIIRHRVGRGVEIARVAVRDLSKRRAVDVERSVLTTNPMEIVNDPTVDVVCELIGGVSPAKEYILQAMLNGKQIVTANKELIAKHGPELMQAAADNGVDFQFEGSVAGGIPILQPMLNGLSGNRIFEIKGIVNGTTNYILSRMTSEGAEFAAVLREAQAHGYAEADPTSDVEGYDAQYKTAILSSIAFNTHVPVSEIYVEGISRVTRRDIECARSLGYVIKLLAIASLREGERIEARVHPTLLPADHPLAGTNDVFNAVHLRGDAVGDLMLYGRGAGMMPTGSAVVGDIIDTCRNLAHGCSGRVRHTTLHNYPVCSVDEVQSRYYIRLLVADRPGVIASVAGVLGENGVSIESVVQHSAQNQQAEIVWVTHTVQEAAIRKALETIRRLPAVTSLENWFRVEE